MTDKELKEIVAKNLAAYRKLNNLTQLELAEKLNYSDKSVSKWERGDGLPDIYVLKTIADYYNITLNDLVSEGKPKRFRSTRRQHIIIPLLSAAIVWLVATFVFMVLNMVPFDIPNATLVFICAIPATFIVLTVYAVMWYNQVAQLFVVSGLIWTVALSIYVSFGTIRGVHLIWCVAAVVELMEILWFFLKFKKERKV